jgi:hypothetical protein
MNETNMSNANMQVSLAARLQLALQACQALLPDHRHPTTWLIVWRPGPTPQVHL